MNDISDELKIVYSAFRRIRDLEPSWGGSAHSNLKLFTEAEKQAFLKAPDLAERLSTFEAVIIRVRLRGGTYDAIADGQGLTRERIRQIENKAYRKIRFWAKQAEEKP